MTAEPDDLFEVTEDGDNIVGPVTIDQMRRGIDAGRVAVHAKARRVGTQEWMPLAAILDWDMPTAPRHPRPSREDAPPKNARADRELPDFGSIESTVTQLLDPLLMRARARLGSTLRNKWHIDSLLGLGGMAAVYAATHRNGSRVAVKILHDALSNNPLVKERFAREGLVANTVGHDGVVKVIDDDVADDGAPYLVSELLDGESLEDRRLRSGGKLPEDEVLALSDQLLDVLSAAHAKGVVHRDIKPENLFLTRAGQLKVLDFGIARLREVSSRASRATQAGTSMGTPAFMAPEQARALWSEVDPRTDLWAVGATMFTLLAGRLVHEGRTTNELLLSAMTKLAPPLASILPGVSASVAHVVERALAFNKEDRWRDASEMREAVGRAYHDRHGSSVGTERPTVPPSVANRTLPARTELARNVTTGPSVVAPNRMRTITLAAALAGFTVGIGALVVVLVSNARKDHAVAVAQSSLLSSAIVPSSIVACPPLQVMGLPQPAGWFGAAASGLACDRMRILLGGRTDRILVPADLLNLPPKPVDDFPRDPFDDPTARDRAVAVAKAQSDVWLDGIAERKAGGIRVDLVLRSKDGRELGHGSASNTLLYASVRGAIDALRVAGALPGKVETSPFVHEWYGAATVDGALALSDLDSAYRLQDRQAMLSECKGRIGVEPSASRLADWLCAARLGLDDPAPVTFDGTTGGEASITGAALALDDPPHDKVMEAGARVQQLRALELTHEGRAVLACVGALLPPFTSSDVQQNDQALAALREDPKAFTPACDPTWDLFFFGRSANAFAAAAAWRPWDPVTHVRAADFEPTLDGRLRAQRRASVLAPRGPVSEAFALSLLIAGRSDEGRSVAGGDPSVQIQVLLPLTEARFGAGLGLATSIVEAQLATSSGGENAIQASFGAVEASLVLRRPIELAASIVARYIDVDPLRIPPKKAILVQAVALCAFAPTRTAQRCLARLSAALQKGELGGGMAAGFADLVSGAERYVRGDWAGAAHAWRPISQMEMYLESPIRHALADVFDRTGDSDLADRVDAPMLAHKGPFGGADLAFVRAAKRASTRGDRRRAVELARKVVDAWSIADVDVPAVREMKKLVGE
jgi:eukaryotic-like serine/threonine-protein kinase